MDREKLYELVKRSPELVDRHDREGWLGLFFSEAVVEDPVGAGLNRKGKDWRGDRDGLSRFYDIFIGPNDIKFTATMALVAFSMPFLRAIGSAPAATFLKPSLIMA
jgi:hypothetical protein